MLNKEMMLTRNGLGGYDEVIEGSITAEKIQAYAGVGFNSGKYGTCTSDKIACLYDRNNSYGVGYNGDGLVLGFSNSVVSIGSAYAIRACLKINDYLQEFYSVQSVAINADGTTLVEIWASLEPPQFAEVIRVIKEGSTMRSVVDYEEPTVYPIVCSPHCFSELRTASELSNLSAEIWVSTRQLGTSYSSTSGGYTIDVPSVGFESGKTYDFTLEYKIDAIITEDGVQTF